jgi:hypothetical protein
MLIRYLLDRYYEGKYVFRVYLEFTKKTKKYKYEDYVLADLIKLYPDYRFIQNLNMIDKNHLYYTAVSKYRNTEKNRMINIGDVKKIKKTQSINFNIKEICVYDILFRLSTQFEYDRYQFILNRNNCNSKLYSFIYNNTLHFFKEKYTSKQKIRETIV